MEYQGEILLEGGGNMEYRRKYFLRGGNIEYKGKILLERGNMEYKGKMLLDGRGIWSIRVKYYWRGEYGV